MRLVGRSKKFWFEGKKGSDCEEGLLWGRFCAHENQLLGSERSRTFGAVSLLRLFSSKTKMDFLSKEKQGVCVLNDLYQEVIPSFTAIPSFLTKLSKITCVLFQKIILKFSLDFSFVTSE